jgi:hypothetical protein
LHNALFREIQHSGYLPLQYPTLIISAETKIGSTHDIFAQHLDHIDSALEAFCNQHWPCEYIQPGGGARCVNVRSSHSAKGHQLTNGKVLTSGGYMSRFSFASHCQQFRSDVFERLHLLLNILRVCMQADHESEEQAATKIHLDNVLLPFYKHCSRDRWDGFISHSACFFCLFEAADYPLPCGHVVCISCLKAFGHRDAENVIEVYGCPMETPRESREHRWKVHLKPNAASIRILTLDGYGYCLLNQSREGLTTPGEAYVALRSCRFYSRLNRLSEASLFSAFLTLLWELGKIHRAINSIPSSY